MDGPIVPLPPETVGKAIRLLRHDVGDFLQSIYAAVAVLQLRLPSDAVVERSLVSGMRARGEECRALLDLLHDLYTPPALEGGSVDLQVLTRQAIDRVARRYAHLTIAAEADGPVPMRGDAARLGQLGHLLLVHACDAAHVAVSFRARPLTDGAVAWEVVDDGPGLTEEQLLQVYEPFTSVRTGRLALGLAPALEIVRLHRGRLMVESLGPIGLRVRAVLLAGPIGE